MISILDQNRKDLIQNMKKRWKAAYAPHCRKFMFKSQLKFLFAFSQPLWAIQGGFYPPVSERQIREPIILLLIIPGDNISLQKLFGLVWLGFFWVVFFFPADSGADQDKSLCFRWSIFITHERKWSGLTNCFLQRLLTDLHGRGSSTAFSGQAALLARGLQHSSYILFNYFCYVVWLTEDRSSILNCKPAKNSVKLL